MTKPPPISEAHIIAIGRLVVAVSKIDILLTDLAAALLRTDIVSAIAAIHHQQIANKIDALKTLVRLNIKGGGAEISSLLSDAKNVANYRNTIVHAAWTVDKEGGTYAVRFQARGKFTRSRVPVAHDQILLNARQADEIVDRLGELRDRLFESSP
jgi:hypothetical protein